MTEPTNPNRPSEDELLQQRLSKLTKALDVRRQDTEETARVAEAAANGGIGKAMGTGFRVASELASAILVGGFLGWLVDYWAGTTPWFLLSFLMLGVAAGFWNVYKLAARTSGGSSPDV